MTESLSSLEMVDEFAMPTADPQSFMVSELAAEALKGGLTRAHQRHIPAATYRLQFCSKFTFQNARQITPYLQALGVTHAYASPYLKAVPGSDHGYDIIDHHALNPEVGSCAEFDAWIQSLRAAKLGHILDFVPNHMGVATDGNAWWQDVLENGPSSTFSSYFDIDWSPLKLDLQNKVLLPVLGNHFGAVLESQQLKLEFERGTFYIKYFQRRFPVTPKSYLRILADDDQHLAHARGGHSVELLEYESILTAIRNLPGHEVTDPKQRHEREREKEVIKRRLQNLCDECDDIVHFIRANVERINGIQGEPHSFDALETLLHDQAYRLSYWRVASDEINYRRFFDVNELAAVCMEQPEVFANSHEFVLSLIEQGKLDGLRIDHADGLYDPAGYLRQLQVERIIQLCRLEYEQLIASSTNAEASSSTSVQTSTEDDLTPDDRWTSLVEPQIRQFLETEFDGLASANVQPLFVVTEKILERNEKLPNDWASAGTTGYDFLNDVNGLFVAEDNERMLDKLYRRFSLQNDSLDELAYHAKRLIMKVAMASELAVLGQQLDNISESNRLTCDHTLNGLTDALREIVANFPVYRTYTALGSVTERDRMYIAQAVARAKRHNQAISHSIFDFINDVLQLKGLTELTPSQCEKRRKFVRRFQQFTGPVMAKSVEDTVFYRYNRLVSLNEVGGNPNRFGVSVAAFHQQNLERQTHHPYSLLATSTHDTKRSEDVRARINVLSEIPAEWKTRVLRWGRWNKRKKVKLDGELAPSRNDEYLLYQTLVGTWPMDGVPGTEYAERICQYMVKAVREGKRESSWIAPNEAYEEALRQFIFAILCPDPASAFRIDFSSFVIDIARAGMWNSLAQTLLKVTSPGIPDIYPGTEVWSLTLVDPDNRQPLDFDALRRNLESLRIDVTNVANVAETQGQAAELLSSAADGRIKLFVLSAALHQRRQLPDLFTVGEYIPLTVNGPYADYLVAFARFHDNDAAIVVVPRLATGLTRKLGGEPWGEIWSETTVELPAGLQNRNYRHCYTGAACTAGSSLSIASLLGEFPVGLLVSE